MKHPNRVLIMGLTAGLALLIPLLLWQGVTPFEQALERMGWPLLTIPFFFLLPMLLACWSWQVLYPRNETPSLGLTYYANWIGLSVNWLLPVAQIGGEIVRVHLLSRRGFTVPRTAAVMVADKTVQVATLILYGLFGLTLFLGQLLDGTILTGALTGMGLLSIALVLFYRIQHAGLFDRSSRWLDRLTGSLRLPAMNDGARTADGELVALYQRRRRLVAAVLLRLGFRVLWAGEIYLVLWMLGYPVTFTEAVILESLTQLVRAAAFAIPAGIGAQEGALVLVGAALGLPTDIGLGLALAKRLRELAIGIPGLVLWHLEESRRLIQPR